MSARQPTLFPVVIALVLGNCAAPRKVRTDEMSARQHEQAAQQDEARAAVDRRQYDPSATATRGGGPVVPDVQYNPTQRKLEEARAWERHAAQHRAAARKLESFEDTQCAGIPPSERDACPFLGGQVARVENIPNGVKLVMADGVSPLPLARLIACHAAFARAEHDLAVDGCPPYVPMVSVTASVDGRGVELKTTTEGNVEELQKRAAAQVGRPKS